MTLKHKERSEVFSEAEVVAEICKASGSVVKLIIIVLPDTLWDFLAGELETM